MANKNKSNGKGKNKSKPRKGTTMESKAKTRSNPGTSAHVSRPSSAKSKAPAPRGSPGVSVAQICGLTDPFCEHAVGSKYPDGANSRTLAYTFRTRGIMAADVNGASANLFVPGYTNIAAVSTNIATTTATFVNIANSGNTFTIAGYRIVSAGLRIRCPISPLNQSGMVFIRGFSTPNGQFMSNVDFGAYNCAFSSDIPLSAINNNGHTDIIFQRTDPMQSRQFVDPATTNPSTLATTWVSPGWGPVVIGVTGAPVSSVPLDVEFVFHYELLFPDNSVTAMLATPAQAANGLLATMSSTVSSTVGNVFNEVSNDVATAVKSVARNVLVNMGKQLFKSSPYLAPAAMLM